MKRNLRQDYRELLLISDRLQRTSDVANFRKEMQPYYDYFKKDQSYRWLMNVYGMMRDAGNEYLDMGGSPVKDTAEAKNRIRIIRKYGFHYFQLTGSKPHDIYLYVQAGARIVGTVHQNATEALLFKVG